MTSNTANMQVVTLIRLEYNIAKAAGDATIANYR